MNIGVKDAWQHCIASQNAPQSCRVSCFLCSVAADQAAKPLQVDSDLRKMLIKPDAPAPQTVGVRVWPRAIPQFNVSHGDTLEVQPSSHLTQAFGVMNAFAARFEIGERLAVVGRARRSMRKPERLSRTASASLCACAGLPS